MTSEIIHEYKILKVITVFIDFAYPPSIFSTLRDISTKFDVIQMYLCFFTLILSQCCMIKVTQEARLSQGSSSHWHRFLFLTSLRKCWLSPAQWWAPWPILPVSLNTHVNTPFELFIAEFLGKVSKSTNDKYRYYLVLLAAVVAGSLVYYKRLHAGRVLYMHVTVCKVQQPYIEREEEKRERDW